MIIAIEDIRTLPGSDPLAFSVRSKIAEYGDNKSFHEYQIVMRLRSKIVGIEAGPCRTHSTRAEARLAGYARIRVLRTHRLYAIGVTNDDIKRGDARSCDSCAIAQALYRNQERMGLPDPDFYFNVAPYVGMFGDCYGISLANRFSQSEIRTGEDDMPDLAWIGKRGLNAEPMVEWAMLFDDWADLKTMTMEEWRDEHGDDEASPAKPWPVSFVLNLTEMKSAEGNE